MATCARSSIALLIKPAYHAAIKHWSSYGGVDFLIKSIEREKPEALHLPIYLGVQFALSLKRSRDSMGVTINWRPDPAKMAKWKLSIDASRDEMSRTKGCTPRAVATIIGRIIWGQHISLRPLLLISDIIDVTRLCAAEAKDGWDCRRASLLPGMKLV